MSPVVRTRALELTGFTQSPGPSGSVRRRNLVVEDEHLKDLTGIDEHRCEIHPPSTLMGKVCITNQYDTQDRIERAESHMRSPRSEQWLTNTPRTKHRKSVQKEIAATQKRCIIKQEKGLPNASLPQMLEEIAVRMLLL